MLMGFRDVQYSGIDKAVPVRTRLDESFPTVCQTCLPYVCWHVYAHVYL